MVYAQRCYCKDCGEGYTVYSGRASGGCSLCKFVSDLRGRYGTGEDADRWIYQLEGANAHDRLLKHEGRREEYMRRYEEAIERMAGGLHNWRTEGKGLFDPLTPEEQEAQKAAMKTVDWRFMKLEQGEVNLDGLDDEGV